MPNKDMLHEFYIKCMNINLMETTELENSAQNENEAEFVNMITNFVLRKKQEQVVADKRF